MNKALPSDAIAVCKLKDFDGGSLVQKVKHAHYKKGRTCSSQTLPFYFFLPCLLLDLRRLHDELYAAGISVVQAAEGLVVFARLLDGFQAADYVAQAGA